MNNKELITQLRDEITTILLEAPTDEADRQARLDEAWLRYEEALTIANHRHAIMTAGDVADMLGVSTQYVGQEIKRGNLIASKFGKAWVIQREEALRWWSSRPRSG